MVDISAVDTHPRKRIAVEDSEMSYVDTGGDGPMTVFRTATRRRPTSGAT